MISNGVPVPRIDVPQPDTVDVDEPDDRVVGCPCRQWGQAKAPTPVMSLPTMRVWMVSVPS